MEGEGKRRRLRKAGEHELRQRMKEAALTGGSHFKEMQTQLRLCSVFLIFQLGSELSDAIVSFRCEMRDLQKIGA